MRVSATTPTTVRERLSSGMRSEIFFPMGLSPGKPSRALRSGDFVIEREKEGAGVGQIGKVIGSDAGFEAAVRQRVLDGKCALAMADKDLTLKFQASSLDALRTAFLRDVMVMRNMSKFFDVDLTKALEM